MELIPGGVKVLLGAVLKEPLVGAADVIDVVVLAAADIGAAVEPKGTLAPSGLGACDPMVANPT